VEFRVLGPLEAIEGGRPVPLGGKKQRALLVMLLVNANRVVAQGRLVEALWGAAPPRTAAAALHAYVSRLRKILPSGDLVTQAPGYVLRVNPELVDVFRFERLVAEAQRALASGDALRASAKLREGLELWRGPVLAELADASEGRSEIVRLEQRRLAALETYGDTRRVLIEELGLEANQSLRRLEQAILWHRPDLEPAHQRPDPDRARGSQPSGGP
jgi:hypothetical protein